MVNQKSSHWQSSFSFGSQRFPGRLAGLVKESYHVIESVKRKTFTKRELLHFLGQLRGSPDDYVTLYARPASFPGYALDAMEQHSLAGDASEALNSEAVLREVERYGTGAVIFWSQTGSRCIVLPPFSLAEDKIFRGRPETSSLQHLIERERILGIVLVTWGSYVVAVVKGDKVLDCKVGTGYIHKKHRKGGRSEKRFARRTEEQKKDFLRKVANRTEERFRSYCPEQIFLGGNRLIAKPLVQECLYLNYRPPEISTRFVNVRHADREAVFKTVEYMYESVVFEY